MKACIKYLSIVVAIIVLLLCIMRLHPYYRYAQPQDVVLEFLSLNNRKDTLKVAFIGDSWADYHYPYDSLLCSMLSKDAKMVSVKSKGNVGAKSKEIYERLSTTTNQILMWHPQYCVISAGINDAVAKLGKDYYVYHYQLILNHLIRLGIKPIVVEIPDVNYRAIANRESWTMRLRHLVSSLLTGSEIYGFESYRASLWSAVNHLEKEGKILYIPVSVWNAGGYLDDREFYQSDETHLNAKGYHLLDSCIASEIILDNKQMK